MVHIRTKFINIDGRFGNYCGNSPFADYFITLPEHIHHVKTFTIVTVEIPVTFYNISSLLDNNYFKVTNLSKNDKNGTMIKLPEKNYTTETLNRTIGNLLQSKNMEDLEMSFLPERGFEISSKNNKYMIDFAVDRDGKKDDKNVKSKLGWLLGFRKCGYCVTNADKEAVVTDCTILNPRYLYLEVEEIDKRKKHKNKHSFSSSLMGSQTSKYIIARITMDYKNFPYGSILNANLLNGYLISNTRHYRKKVEIKELQFRLLNEFGFPVFLNGFDISFCIQVECEEHDDKDEKDCNNENS